MKTILESNFHQKQINLESKILLKKTFTYSHQPVGQQDSDHPFNLSWSWSNQKNIQCIFQKKYSMYIVFQSQYKQKSTFTQHDKKSLFDSFEIEESVFFEETKLRNL